MDRYEQPALASTTEIAPLRPQQKILEAADLSLSAVQNVSEQTAESSLAHARIVEALGDDWKLFPAGEQEQFVRIVEQAGIARKSATTNRRPRQEQLERVAELNRMCAQRGIELNKLADLFEFTPWKLREKMNVSGSEGSPVIPLMTEAEMKVMAEVGERYADGVTPKPNQHKVHMSDATRKLGVAWLRLQRQSQFDQLVSLEFRQVHGLTIARMSQAEYELKGKHLSDLLPKDLRAVLNPPPPPPVEEELKGAGAELDHGDGSPVHADKTIEEPVAAAAETLEQTAAPRPPEAPAHRETNTVAVIAQILEQNQELIKLLTSGNKNIDPALVNSLLSLNTAAARQLLGLNAQTADAVPAAPLTTLHAPSANGEHVASGPEAPNRERMVFKGAEVLLPEGFRGTVTVTEFKMDGSGSVAEQQS